MRFKDYLFAIINLIVFVLSLITDWNRILVAIIMVNLLLMILDKLGRGIVLRELMGFYSAFICLFMPLMGFMVYTQDHPLARLWVRYMDIPEQTYFSFALPAMAGFLMAVTWPLSNDDYSDMGESIKKLINRAKSVLIRIPKIGTLLMIIGAVVFVFADFLPAELKFVFMLLYFASFTGFLYVYYQPNMKWKIPVLILFGTFILSESLSSGMFTIVAYMGLTLFSFFFLGKRFKLWKKVTVILVGILLLFLIQSVKVSYRTYTWRGVYQGNKFALFVKLIGDKLTDPINTSQLSNEFFPIYYRANQGYNVMMVMKRFPSYIPHDQGQNLGTVILSSFVPRVFWPDKPEAGGRANMLYYTGFLVEGWSTNVGPLGEAYASFGTVGGIIYMFLLGVLIRWAFLLVLRSSRKYPLVLFWLPVIFYQVTYSAEADTLQIVNSITKSAFFVWLLFRFQPIIFGVNKSVFVRHSNSSLKSPAIR